MDIEQLNEGFAMTASESRPTEQPPDSFVGVLKALADPMRLSIVQQMAAVDELACTTLEKTLPIAKATISYHIKILVNAKLVTVRREGRFFFYTLRRGTLDEMMLLGMVGRLEPVPDVVDGPR